MNDTERLKLETENLEKLKRHLNAVLNLKPIEGLSPLSVSILKTSKVFRDEIDAWAGSLCFHKGLDKAFLEMLDAMSVNCDIDERQVIEIVLESFVWVSDTFEGYPFSVCKSLDGGEVSWAWDFLMMSDDEIEAVNQSDDKLKREKWRKTIKDFADLGIDVLKHGESGKTDWEAFNQANRQMEVFMGSNREINDRIAKTAETESLEPTLKETELAEGFVNEFIRSHFGFNETSLAEVSDRVLSLYVSEKLAKTVREHPNMVTELTDAMNYDLVCIQSGDGESELKQPTCARKKRGEVKK